MTYSPSRAVDTEWRGQRVTNFEDRHGQAVAAIVQHRMGRDASGNLATMGGTQSWFENKASKVSAHFGVGFDGQIWQWVMLSKSAWANGIIEKPDASLPWLAECVEKKLNPNWRTISIEFEGDSDTIMPEKQYQAGLALNRWLLAVMALPANSRTIVRHSQITGLQRMNCPGNAFPMVRLLKDLGAYGVMPKTFIDPVTRIAVNEIFAAFYLTNGGLPIFGRPIRIAEPASGKFGQATAIQWFERARFELQPDGQVLLGLLGSEALNG